MDDSFYGKRLKNKRKNFVERNLKGGISPYRVEEMASNIFDRTIPDSVHQQIINTPLSTPAYVFSTDTSYTSFKGFADSKAAGAVEKVSSTVEKIYAGVPEISGRIKQIEAKEKEIALKLCQAFGFEIGGDPRSNFKREFEKFMNGQHDDRTTQALIDINAETISYNMVSGVFYKQIGDYKDSKKNKTQSRNIIKRNFIEDAKEEQKRRDLATKAIMTSDISNGSVLYQRVQNAKELAETSSNAMAFISIGKGYVQEIRIGELMRRFLSQEPDIEKQVGKIIVNPVGNAESKKEMEEKVTKSLMGKIQKGIDTSGESGKLSTTDIVVSVPSAGEILNLNIDVKTSDTEKYVKHSFKFTVPELEKSWPLMQKDIFNLGIMAIINNANVTKRVSKYSGLDQATRPLVGSVLTNEKFISSFIPDPKTVESKDFQNIIVLNDRLFWYSELVHAIPKNVLDTATGKGKKSFYDFTMMLEDYQPLLSLASTQSSKLLQLKRKVLKRKLAKSKKTYEERQPILMADPDIQNLFTQYRQAANSLSFNVALKFDIYDIL
jgi:hypothetical protein